MKLHGRALQHVAAGYALGSLGVRARRRFEAHLAHDVMARRAWHQWEERLSVLALDLPPVRPPDKSWQAISVQVEPAPRRRRRPRAWVWIAALLVLGAAIVLWRSG